MNTMTAASAALQPLVSRSTRAATALGVMAAVSLACLGAAQASHEAVDLTTAQLNREVTRIQLPTIVVIGQREVQLAAARPADRL